MELLRKLIVLLIVVGSVWAKNEVVELYRSLFPQLFHKPVIGLYVTDPALKEELRKVKLFKIVSRCEEADIVVGQNEICPDRWHFVDSYEEFKKGKMVLGAFYWRKGRPQLRLKKAALLQVLGRVPKELERYVVE